MHCPIMLTVQADGGSASDEVLAQAPSTVSFYAGLVVLAASMSMSFSPVGYDIFIHYFSVLLQLRTAALLRNSRGVIATFIVVDVLCLLGLAILIYETKREPLFFTTFLGTLL